MHHTPKRSRSALAALTVGSLAVLTACGSGTHSADSSAGGTSGGSSGGGSKVIAFSPLGLQIPAMQDLSKGIQAYSKSKGYSVIVQDPALDPQKQATDLQSVIESGRVKGAWVIAVQPAALSALVKVAQKKKVALLLNGVPADYGLSGMQQGITFDQIDYAAQGKALGEELGSCINEKLNGKAQVLFEENSPGTAGKQPLETAAKKALAATAPNAKIVTSIVAKNRDQVQTDVGNALQGKPDVRAVLANNDEGSLGALGAFASAGKDLTCVTEAGGNAEVLKDVKAGKIYASVALQFQGDMVQSFDTLAKLMADPTVTGSQLTVPQKVIKAGS